MPRLLLFLLRFQIQKTWKTVVQRGTGSITFLLKNVYVSKHRTVEAVLSEKKAITLKNDILGKERQFTPSLFQERGFKF
ncbi:hypothetical protein AKG34_08565 [Peribacillus butanolivorans]|uniref:hypothetical protein n=1 Tax=Peribacillus butanolivorans TaxID=421767 RepID=UPI0006A6AF3A|nr:hypothetical protein [Peribacillus butanolivorans]KON68839.1 hypothetical protein AKG34_08565 [Peribacillus butanolivorans]